MTATVLSLSLLGFITGYLLLSSLIVCSLSIAPSPAPTVPKTISKTEFDSLHDFYVSLGGPYWFWEPFVQSSEGVDSLSSTGSTYDDPLSMGDTPSVDNIIDIIDYITIPGYPWNFTNYHENNPCQDQWQGIDCICLRSNCSITTIGLRLHNLSGTFPNTIGGLSSLTKLLLSQNRINGSLDPLTSLQKLNALDLKENLLSGPLPLTMNSWTSLTELRLAWNDFTGVIPDSFYSITTLRELDLSGCPFQPASFSNNFSNLTSLRVLNLFDTHLTGDFPAATILSMPQLEVLYLANNSLQSTVPNDLFLMPKLRVFVVLSNELTGTLPNVSATNQTKLTQFQVSGNHFHGPIPETICSLSAVRTLWIANNHLSGELPSCVPLLPNLVDLGLNNNQLTGRLPESFVLWNSSSSWLILDISFNMFSGPTTVLTTNRSNLLTLLLVSNQFTGQLPFFSDASQEVNLTTFAVFGVSTNYFTGQLLSGRVGGQAFQYFVAADNLLSGTLPLWSTSSSTLLVVNLGNNSFSGPIPAVNDIGGVTKLRDLFLNDCGLTGAIPSSLASLTNLQQLNLDGNLLTGSVPPLFSEHKKLIALFLASNRLTGNLSFLAGEAPLVNVDVSSNSFTGTLPSCAVSKPTLQIFVASSNCLHGTIPESICNAEMLSNIVLEGLGASSTCQQRMFPSFIALNGYLAEYSVGGTIPSCLFKLPQLSALYLSANQLTGSIPTTIVSESSSSFQTLVLNHNMLSGSLPSNLMSRSWSTLDLSFNKFDGVLPSQAIELSSQIQFLGLNVNRLSGFIPREYRSLAHIKILESNLFSCNFHRQQLPDHDPDATQYSCGSDVVNNALIGGTVVMIATVALVVYVMWTSLSSVTKVIREDRLFATTGFGGYCIELWKITMFVIHQARALKRSYNDELSATSKDESSVCCSNPLRSLREMHHRTRKIGTELAILAAVILLPLYCALSLYESTYAFAYSWSVSGIMLSGKAASIILLVVYCSIIGFMFVRIMKQILSGRENATANSVERRLSKVAPTVVRSTMLANIGAMAVCTIGNFMVMILVDIAYLTAYLRLTNIQLLILQLFLSMFKLGWNEIFLWRFFPSLKSLFHRCLPASVRSSQAVNIDGAGTPSAVELTSMEQLATSAPSVTGANDVPISETYWTVDSLLSRYDVGFLVLTTMLNKVVIPCIAVAAVSSDCFKTALFPNLLVTSYSVETCSITTVLPNDYCYMQYSMQRQIVLYPPFTYRYQCTQAFVTAFTPLFVFTFLLVGVVIPIVKILAARLVTVLQEDSQLRTLVMAMVPPVLQPLRCAPGDNRCDFILKDKLVVRLASYLAVICTFGMLFPPLALIGCVSLSLMSYFEELCVGRLLWLAKQKGYSWYRSAIEKDCIDIVSAWQGVVWLLLSLTALSFALIVFDTTGDRYGWRTALVASSLILSLPVLIFVYRQIALRWGLPMVIPDTFDSTLRGRSVSDIVVAVKRASRLKSLRSSKVSTSMKSLSTSTEGDFSMSSDSISESNSVQVDNPIHDANRLESQSLD